MLVCMGPDMQNPSEVGGGCVCCFQAGRLATPGTFKPVCGEASAGFIRPAEVVTAELNYIVLILK
jgi:hypothetical protein